MTQGLQIWLAEESIGFELRFHCKAEMLEQGISKIKEAFQFNSCRVKRADISNDVLEQGRHQVKMQHGGNAIPGVSSLQPPGI
jgi:hypothetical protein